MEELAPILWIVIAAGVLLTKSSSKARRAARKAAGQPEEQGSKAWPSWDAKTRPAQQPNSPATAAAPAPAFESVARQVAAVREAAGHRPKTKRTAELARQQSPTQEPEAPNENTAERFDLRRAIIYSEILKPKFDE